MGSYENEDEMMNETMCIGDGTYCQNANYLIKIDINGNPTGFNKSSTVYKNIEEFVKKSPEARDLKGNDLKNFVDREAEKIAKEIQEIADLICDIGQTIRKKNQV